MSCSLARIVTEIPDNMEWIKDEVNGLLVPIANSKKIAEKILWLSSDSKLRMAIKENAAETVMTKVNWQKNIQKLTK